VTTEFRYQQRSAAYGQREVLVLQRVNPLRSVTGLVSPRERTRHHTEHSLWIQVPVSLVP